MTTISGTLSIDETDAAHNRPVLVLQPAEMTELAAILATQPKLHLLRLVSATDGARLIFGAGQFPDLRHEIHQLLTAITARQLPSQLVLALALQRLDTACLTAQELGLNLYLTVEHDE